MMSYETYVSIKNSKKKMQNSHYKKSLAGQLNLAVVNELLCYLLFVIFMH